MLLFQYLKKFIIFIKYRKLLFRKLGKNCEYKFLNSIFHYPENIELSDNVHIGDYADFCGRGGIFIGKGAIFAKCVSIYSSEHYFDGEDLRAIPFDNRIILKPVRIGEYSWIGRGVIILSGVKIGKGAIIGAGSIVSKDIPDYAIAVGNPIEIKKYRNKEVFDNLYKKDISVFEKLGHKKELINESNSF